MKGTPRLLGKQAAEGGFAGAAKADEGRFGNCAGWRQHLRIFPEAACESSRNWPGGSFLECGGLIEGRRSGLGIGGEHFDGNVEGVSEDV